MLSIGLVSNETNADVCMYIEEFILVEIWIHCCTKLKYLRVSEVFPNVGTFCYLNFKKKCAIIICFSVNHREEKSIRIDCLIHFHMLNIGLVSNETNADVRMYIEEFILVEIWIHYCTKLKYLRLFEVFPNVGTFCYLN